MSKQRAKGTDLEVLMRDYFRQWWPGAHRPATSGKNDTGDINGTPLPLELKNWVTPQLPQWHKEAAKEADNAGAMFCPIVYKRSGTRDPAKQWVSLEAWMLVEFLLCWEEVNMGGHAS